MNDHFDLPPLPTYHLTPLPSLVHPIPDKLLSLIAPIVAYWGLSMFFHWLDTRDFFPQYRLHTPAEVLKRNRVSRWEVVRDVVVQQLIQTVVGWLLGMTEPADYFGKEDYDIAVWARRIRMAQRAIPGLLAVLGIDAATIGKNLAPQYPILSSAIQGGYYPSMQGTMTGIRPVPTFAPWEMTLAWTIYNILVPIVQYAVAIVVVDTWQYFMHRAMHMNKWLYTRIHSRHHRLYVPYAYGALYNHPFEGFFMDTLGATVAYKLAGFNTRQGMYFFTGTTMKTVDDHCGYALPFDPLQLLTSNNAGYHDVHHQSWGIKTNFSQPFFTFWDCLLGTVWTGGDVSARYEKTRVAAKIAFDRDQEQPVTGSYPDSSTAQAPQPYEHEAQDAKELRSIPSQLQSPQPPAGKAHLQAIGSRQSVLDDIKDGGPSVLADEAEEEAQAQAQAQTINAGAATPARRSPRKRATSSLTSSKDNFKGLRDRVTGSMHARTGIIGVDGSR